MSTRCNILIGDHQFYHHWDGYPDGVGADLAYFIANVNAGYLERWSDTIDHLAQFVAEHGIIGRLGSCGGGDRGYEAEEFGLHGDIEFLYIVSGESGDYRLYCVDVWKFIEDNPSPGRAFDHPFFSYNLPTIKKKFIKAEYRMHLPSADVPEDQRLYASTGIFSHDEAKYCGMRKELGYGEKEWETGIIRVRNERGYPTCTRCGERMTATDMKCNGKEGGEYYETYKCPNCLEWFSVTYDTPDDSGNWTVSCSKKVNKPKVLFRKWDRRGARRCPARTADPGRPWRSIR